MYRHTMKELEKKIESNTTISSEQKKELLETLEKLDNELSSPDVDTEKALSIANFANSSTHEAAKSTKDTKLFDLSLEGLKKSIEGFEATHPTITEAADRLINILSSMGI